MTLDTIKPADLELLKNYLTDLRGLPKTLTEEQIYKRWGNQIAQLHEITSWLLRYLYKTDPQGTQQASLEITNRLRRDEFMVFKPHIDFLLGGIQIYLINLETNLLQSDLWDKPISQMTGFELRTLILSTLKNHVDRQKS